jgi:predicted transcriptional regulator
MTGKLPLIGIASYEEMKARTMAIVKGGYKPAPHEPKLWFTSQASAERALRDKYPLVIEATMEEDTKGQ